MGAVLAAVCLSAAVQAAGPPPNVVLVVADDLGWRDYGFMGHPHVRTPRLDRLAAESLVFTRGYVPASLCSPSLASLITGRYPHQHGVFCNDPPAGEGGGAAPASRDGPAFRAGRAVLNARIAKAETLPRLLRRLGYDSLQTGKWWQGAYAVGHFTHGMTAGDEARGGRHGDEGLAIGRQTMAPVVEFLDRAAGAERPFLIWYAPMLPHQPHDAPDELVASYRSAAGSEHVARYWANITRFDETCGQILDMLAERKLDENTLVVYLADNGWIQDPLANRYAARSKQSPYDGGLRTPIMLRWPGRIAPRRDEEHAVTSLDIVPTVAAATGAERPADLAGVNLLNGKAVASRPAIFGEIFLHTARSLDDPVASLRFRWAVAGEWKLIVPRAVNEPEAAVELFNLRDDPDEANNLAPSHAGQVAALKDRLDDWWSLP